MADDHKAEPIIDPRTGRGMGHEGVCNHCGRNVIKERGEWKHGSAMKGHSRIHGKRW